MLSFELLLNHIEPQRFLVELSLYIDIYMHMDEISHLSLVEILISSHSCCSRSCGQCATGATPQRPSDRAMAALMSGGF